MHHRIAAVALAAGALMILPPAANAAGSMMKTEAPQGSAKLQQTKNALRGLWHGHIVAVRKVVVAALAGKAGDEKTAETEVVANAHDIANAFVPYYGQAAADKLFSLLAGHYGAVKDYLTATMAKDQAAQSKATNEITDNADQIATFLSGANPNWPKATLLELLQIHGSQHISQIQELAAGDKTAEAKTWTDMSAHMNVIADALADGLARQFPAKFS